MKYTWEKEDVIEPWGRYVMLNVSDAKDDYKNLPHIFKIGGDGTSPALICMGDGLIQNFENMKKLLEYLNNSKTGFRPVRRGELLRAIEHNWHRHEAISQENY